MRKSTSTTRVTAAAPAVLRTRRVLGLAWRAVVGAVVAAAVAAVPAAAAPPPALGLLATVTIGGHPQAVAVDPTTNTVYVAGWNAIGSGVVWALNGATGQPRYGPIAIWNQPSAQPGFGPDAIAVDPNTHLVYVTNSLNDTLSIVNGSDLAAPVLTVPLSGQLQADNPDVAADAASDTVYVAASDGVEVLNGRTGQPTHAPLDPADAPFGPLALDPSTHTIYAGGDAYAGASGFVRAINESTGMATISASEVVLVPDDLALDPSTQRLYSLSGYLTVVSEVSNKILEYMGFDYGFGPGGLAVDPASDTVFVLDAGNDKLWALNGADPSASDPTLKLGRVGADGLAVDAATGTAYITNSSFGTLSIVVPHATSAPDAPTSVSATAAHGAAVVRFVTPSDGRSPITSYTATATDQTNPTNGGQTATITGITLAEGGPVITVNGLTAGDTHTFTVTATNAVGAGPASSSSNPVVPTTRSQKGRSCCFRG